MAEQLLNRSDVVAVFEQVCRERVAKRVAAGAFGKTGVSNCRGDLALNDGFVQVKPRWRTKLWITADASGGKDELPRPRLGCARQFPVERIWQYNRAESMSQVSFMQHVHTIQVLFQRLHNGTWQHRHAVLPAFCLPDGDLQPLEVDILDTQTRRPRKLSGGRTGRTVISEDTAIQIVDTWLATPFEGGRHVARIRKLDAVG